MRRLQPRQLPQERTRPPKPLRPQPEKETLVTAAPAWDEESMMEAGGGEAPVVVDAVENPEEEGELERSWRRRRHFVNLRPHRPLLPLTTTHVYPQTKTFLGGASLHMTLRRQLARTPLQTIPPGH
eukprot:6200423-Pleurochrysis_carterae.AAC.3